jgi:hypothetical protein
MWLESCIIIAQSVKQEMAGNLEISTRKLPPLPLPAEEIQEGTLLHSEYRRCCFRKKV